MVRFCARPLVATAWMLTCWSTATLGQETTTWGQNVEVPVLQSPLKLVVAGAGDSAFARTWTAEGRNTSNVLSFRHQGLMNRDGYRGRVYLNEFSMRWHWLPTTATMMAQNASEFAGKELVFGQNGRITHGRIEIAYILFSVPQDNNRSCFSYYGAIERWSISGFFCAPPARVFATNDAEALIRGIGYRDVLPGGMPVVLPGIPAGAATAVPPPAPSAAPSIATPLPPSPAAAAPGIVTGSPADRLRSLQALRDQGLITEAEHQARRKAILDSL